MKLFMFVVSALLLPYSSALSKTPPTPPKLAVVIVVDQMRPDYLLRFQSLFSKNGFNLLREKGAVLEQAHHSHVPTYTAPGHSVISTGAVPASSGIVGNAWFDRSMGRNRGAVEDDKTTLVLSPDIANAIANDPLAKLPRVGSSPRQLLVPTVGDDLRRATHNTSHVVAVSLKDRSAILSAGYLANGAYWFDDKSGSFCSSSFYGSALPTWVNEFNAKHPIANYKGKEWSPLPKVHAFARALPPKEGALSLPTGKAFPYVLANELSTNVHVAQQFPYTPFADTLLVDFALSAIVNEKLGRHASPDLLYLSISSTDLIGHVFGPDSEELADMYTRLDDDLSRFLSELNKVTHGSFAVVLTADHGVSEIPEQLKAAGFPALRLSIESTVKVMENALAEKFGAGKYIDILTNDQVYFRQKTLREKKLSVEDAATVAGESALEVEGIVRYFTAQQMASFAAANDSYASRVMNGYYRGRSGDLSLVLAPHALFAEPGIMTTHGSGYTYDTHVPLIFYGKSFRQGHEFNEVSTLDIVPTLSTLLGIHEPAAARGRVLGGVFR